VPVLVGVRPELVAGRYGQSRNLTDATVEDLNGGRVALLRNVVNERILVTNFFGY